MSLYRSPVTIASEDKARQEIAKHETHITLLQSQINGLIHRISDIENEKRKHRNAIMQCLSVLSLANRMPNEVLVRIFELAVLDRAWTIGPVILSQVCSSWRAAAQAPSVWSQVYVDCDKGDPAARCKLWFKMACNSFLDVVFRSSMQLCLTQSAFSLLKVKMDQWRSFHLDAHTLEMTNLVLSQFSESAKNLAELSVNVGDSSAPTPLIGDEIQQPMGQLTALSESLRDAPNLRSVTIVSDQSRVWVGLPQITCLILQLSGAVFDNQRPIFASEIMDVLEASLNLRNFSLSIPRDGERALADFVGEPVRVVSLVHLRSLTLEMSIAFMSIIKHFETPKLESLYLRCPDAVRSFADDIVRASIRRFLDISGPPLRLLHLYDVDVSQEDFARIFSEIPTIESLFLHGSDILDETLEHLVTEPLFLTTLRRMEFRWCGHVSGDAIERVVSARAGHNRQDGETVTPLEEITLIACSGVKENDILRIGELCRCRLKIHDENDFCRKPSI